VADRIIGRLAYKIVGDDKEFKKALQKSTRELERTADRFQAIGRGLSIAVTAPLLAAGGAMIRAAIEAEETENKFRVAFSGIEESADEATEALAEGFGLSTDEAQRLLSGTGDLLKGFGATAEEALGLSSQVQGLASDLASYNNLAGGTEQASRAITAALLGEREQLKQLGVVIRQEDVNQRLFEKGQADLTGQARLLAQAQATLELTVEQSTDAIGDYARSGGSAAQQIRELQSQTREMAVELGQELLPAFQAIITQVSEMIGVLQGLDDEQKTMLIRVAAIAAAMGPMSLAIGTGIKAFTALKLAAVALGGASGLGLVVFALGAVVTAVRVIRGPIREARDSLDELAGASESTATELDQVARALSESEQFSASFEDVRRNVVQIADASGRTVDEVIEIGRASSRLSDEYKDQLGILDEQRGNNAQAIIDGEIRAQLAERQTSAAQTELEAQEDITSEIEAQVSLQRETWDEYWSSVNSRWAGLGRNISIYTTNLQTIADIEDGSRRQNMLEQMERMLELDVGMLTQESEFPIVAAARRDLLEQIRGLMVDTSDEAGTQADLTERQLALLGEVESRTTAIKDTTSDTASIWHDLQRNVGDYGNLQNKIVDSLKRGYQDTFEIFGEGIVSQELSLESLGEAYKSMFVTILRALGDEFLARAVAATAMAFIPGLQSAGAGAAGLYAASALAYTASGAVSAFANGGSFVADQPTLALFGENGPETVDIQPVPKVGPPGAYSGGGQSIVINGDVYGYADFAQKVKEATSRATRTGRIR